MCEEAVKDQEEFNRHCAKTHGGNRFITLKTIRDTVRFRVLRAVSSPMLLDCRLGKRKLKKVVWSNGEDTLLIKGNLIHCSIRFGRVRSRAQGIRQPHASRNTTPHCTSFLKVWISDTGPVIATYCTAHIGFSSPSTRQASLGWS
ncbi:hypothetical protein GCK32_014284 [Trichostrongylus colubriformis]|uniref:Uncharacterized protein n=1 Tax=Trichostrongylus colubriformis TaxID=6319 RepID=A0AAN8F174_TRICO